MGEAPPVESDPDPLLEDHSSGSERDETEPEEEQGEEMADIGQPAETEEAAENDGEKDGENGGDDEDMVSDEDEPEDLFDDSKLSEISVVDRPDSPEGENKVIKELESDRELSVMREGEPWFVVHHRWWKQWTDFTKFGYYSSFSREMPAPGEITNGALLDPYVEGQAPRVKKALMENYDYVLVNRAVWANLHHWYGGGPAIPRRVIESGYYAKVLTVEIRPVMVRVFKSSEPEKFESFFISKADTVLRTKRRFCKAFGFKTKDIQLWDFHGGKKYKHLNKDDAKIDGCQILDNQALMLQEKDDKGAFPKEEVYRSSYSYSSSYQPDNTTYGSATDPGTVGLQNLGNTCFMNSALQCLSHTPPVIRYFFSKAYKDDINTTNVLGLQGKLAEQYGDLVSLLWSGSHSSVSPRLFKQQMERFAPQFAGYQQHDSQELLGFLLDGLHEDLNRITDKPYRELPDADGRDVDEVADEEWAYFHERNSSALVDMFMGQLRSELTCPKCNRVANKFDPSMTLTLPLPMKQTRTILCRMVLADGKECSTEYGVTVKKYATFRAFKQQLSTLTRIPAENLRCASTSDGRFFDLFEDRDTVEPVRERDIIYAYEVEANPPRVAVKKEKQDDGKEEGAADSEEEEPELFRTFSVYQRKMEVVRPWYGNPYDTPGTFGLPMMISLRTDREYTYRELAEIIYNRMARFITIPFEDIWTWDANAGQGGDGVDSDSSTDTGGTDGVDADEAGDEGDAGDAASAAAPPIPSREKKPWLPPFHIIAVDQTGRRILDEYKDNGEPIVIDPRHEFLAVHWTEQGFKGSNSIYTKADNEVNRHHTHPSVDPPAEPLATRMTLNKCLEMFMEEEQLGEDDMWYCSKCQEHVQATKKFDLWRLPPYLAVHLKRFGNSESRWSGREKLDTFVEYPHTLDLTPHVRHRDGAAPPVYELYAVSCHFGGMGGGHYTAYAKNHVTQKWYNFDDSHVSEVSPEKVVCQAGYVLLYRRKDTFSSDDLALDSKEEFSAGGLYAAPDAPAGSSAPAEDASAAAPADSVSGGDDLSDEEMGDANV